MYITIEGVIGSGKTSLASILSEQYKAHAVYEKFKENPYLEKFYENIEKYSFQTETFFLIDRYNQMLEIKADYLEENKSVISDYNLAKSLIFAKKTLSDKDYIKFQKIYNILVDDFIKPDLTIIIKSDLETLKKNIKKRGRLYELSMEDDYLLYLIDKYEEYTKILKEKYPNKVVVIDGTKFDFVNIIEHQNKIKEQIRIYLGE